MVVELFECKVSFNWLMGKIIEILGDNLVFGMEIEIVLCNYDILYVWGEVVEK